MNHIGGIGGSSSSARWRKTSLSKRGEKALATITPEYRTAMILGAHNDSEGLRQFAERFRKRKNSPQEDTTALFELDEGSGQIQVNIYDTHTGVTQVKLTPEEVARGLKDLEESDDDSKNLSSFFLDLKI